MKVSVIITTLLVAQVSASFFDVFQGAVLSVQNSFGKLLSDVVTDVKETVDCTILAVEHVLSLSHDATTRYYHKCGSETNKTDSVSDARQDASLPKVEVTLNLPNNEKYLQKVIPAEIDARINETFSKVLGNFKPHNNVLSLENVLAKESEQLTGVRVLVKKELEKLSNEVSKDLKKMEKQRDSEASVDTILQQIKVLEKREQNSKNTSEANEIHLVIDQVLGKLDAIEATEATENFKLEEILKDLESNSNNNLVGLRHQLEEWKEEESRHLSKINSKIEEHEKLIDHVGPYTRHESNHTQPVIFNTDINKNDVDTNENSQDISSHNSNHVKETFDSSTSTRTIGDTNHKSLLIANSSSSSQNYMFNELNYTVITSTSDSSIESPLESVIIIPFENPNDKQQSLASNKPIFLPINEDNANETVIVSTKTITATDTSSIDSPNLVANNNAVVTSAAQNTEAVLTSSTLESFKNENSKDSAKISTIASMMVENPSVNASNSENESVTTLDHIESTETMTPSIPTSFKVSSTATVNEEFSIVIAYIVSDNDSNNTILPNSSTILESTSITENVLPEQTAVTFGGDHSTTELPIIMRINVSNDTLVISPSMPTVETTPVSETIKSEKTTTAFGKENSLIFTTNIVDDTDSNDTIASTSLISKSAPLSKAIQTEETGTTENGESTEVITESTITSTTRNGGDSDTTLINTPIPNISTYENEKIQATLSTSSTTSSVSKEFSTITTTIINSNYSNTPMITDPSTMLDITPVSKTTEPEKPTKASDKRKSSIESNQTLKTTTSTTMEGTPVIETIQPEENSTSAGNDESTEAITELTSTSITDKDSETTITSTPTTIIKTSTSESETIQAVDTTTLSKSEEYLSSTPNRLTEIPNTADGDEDDDTVSATVVMSTLETISESISEGNILAPEDEKRLPSTRSPPKTFPVTLMDTDSNSDDIITSTPFLILEMTTVSEVTDLVENTTITEDEEPSMPTSPATVRNEVPIENNDPIVTVTNKTKNTDSAVLTEIIQKVETTTAAEEKELSSTSTQSAMNNMVTSTAFSPIESIPTSENLMASRNEGDLGKPPRLEAKTSRAPEVLNSLTLNLIVRNPPLTIAPPVNREWLTPNKLNQQNYNTNGEQRNNYEFNGPVSLSDRLLQTRQPSINPEIPINGKSAMPAITRGLFNDAPKWLPANRLIPDFPGQPPKLDNDALQKASFDIFDSVHERFSDSDLPFGPEKDSFKTMPLIPNTPREPMGPPRMYYENPSYVPQSQHPIRPPYSFDSASENTYVQLSLTTHRPVKTAAHANNYKNPSFDYDSFFHLRDPEAHQRALKEARHLMSNSKRSDRIINNIMKNKNKFNARPIFG